MKYNLELENPVIASLGVKSIIEFYNAMSIDKIEIEGVFAFITGVPSPFLNVVIDVRKSRNNSENLPTELKDFFKKYNMSWVWFINPASYDNNLESSGFFLIEEAPAMYFDLTQRLPTDVIRENIIIQELDRHDDLRSWIAPIKEAYEVPEDDDSFRSLNYEILQKGSNQFKHFIAKQGNEVVASGTLFYADNSVMLHNLATKKSYMKQGIGSALTIFMMNNAKLLGFKHCFLDSSEDGFNMYKRIGFKIYSTNLAYGNTVLD